MSRSTKSTKTSKSSQVDIVNFALSAILAGDRLKINTWGIMAPYYAPSLLKKRTGTKNLEKSMRNRLPLAMKWFDEQCGSSSERLLECPELWSSNIAELFTIPISMSTLDIDSIKAAKPVRKSTGKGTGKGAVFKNEHKTTTKYATAKAEYPVAGAGAASAKAAKVAAFKKAAQAQIEPLHVCFSEGCGSSDRTEPLISTKGKAVPYYGCPRHLSELQVEYNESQATVKAAKRLAKAELKTETKGETKTKTPSFSMRALSAAALNETAAVELKSDKKATKAATKGDTDDHPMRCTASKPDDSRCPVHVGTSDMGPIVGRRCRHHKTAPAYHIRLPLTQADADAAAMDISESENDSSNSGSE